MRRLSINLFIAILSVAALSLTAGAQDQPKAEFFGGYQFSRIGGESGANTNGWNMAITGNVNRWLGVTADFSGMHKDFSGVSARAHTFTFGPVVSARGERATPFAHVLVGGFHVSGGFEDLSAATSGFALITGGGVDIKATEHLAVRAFQFDWLMWRAEGVNGKLNARISTGLVFRY